MLPLLLAQLLPIILFLLLLLPSLQLLQQQPLLLQLQLLLTLLLFQVLLLLMLLLLVLLMPVAVRAVVLGLETTKQALEAKQRPRWKLKVTRSTKAMIPPTRQKDTRPVLRPRLRSRPRPRPQPRPRSALNLPGRLPSRHGRHRLGRSPPKFTLPWRR